MKKLNELYNCQYNTLIKGISINSKTTLPGDIFVCIKGNKVDRHDYIDEAIQNGAVALITSKEVVTNVPYIIVDNPNEEVIPLSKKIYDNPDKSLKMFSVTGTDGKTSVATIVSQLIGQDRCGYIGTNGRSCAVFNKETDNTTPSADKLYQYLDEFLHAGCTDVCMESSSEAMLQGRLKDLSFDCIGITNITKEHLNSHKTLENYIHCKKEIMRLAKKDGYCILNQDDKYYEEVKKYCQSNILTYGKNRSNDLQIVNYKLYPNKTDITFKYKNKEYHITSSLLGEFNAYNLACAILMCLSQGYKIQELLPKTNNLYISGRLEIIDMGQDFTVMVDYAHTPNGIENLLNFVHQLDAKRIITVIGQAGERDAEKRKEVGKIVATNSDLAIFCYEDPRSENPIDIINMMCTDIRHHNNYQIIVDRSHAIKYAIEEAKSEDIVLILGKGNETYQKLKDKVIYFNDIEEAKKHLHNKIDNVYV